MECPFCDGRATIKKRLRQMKYKCGKFTVNAEYYKCDKCNEEFTTTELDTKTINKLHKQYGAINHR